MTIMKRKHADNVPVAQAGFHNEGFLGPGTAQPTNTFRVNLEKNENIFHGKKTHTNHYSLKKH